MGRILRCYLGRVDYFGQENYFGHYLGQMESTHCSGERGFRAPLPRSSIPTRTLLQISATLLSSHVGFHRSRCGWRIPVWDPGAG